MCSQDCNRWLLALPHVHFSTWKNSAPTGWSLMKFDIWVFFFKSVEIIQISLKSDKTNRYFTWRSMYIYDNISLNSCQNEKCFRQNYRENQNTILCSITFSWKLCHAGYLAHQTHTHHIQYLLLSHSNNSYVNTPQCYVYRYTGCLVEILASKYIIKFKKVQKEQDNSTDPKTLCYVENIFSGTKKTFGYVQ